MENNFNIPCDLNSLWKFYLPGYPLTPDHERYQTLCLFFMGCYTTEQMQAKNLSVENLDGLLDERNTLEYKMFMDAFCNFARQYGEAVKKNCENAYWDCESQSYYQEAKAILNAPLPELIDTGRAKEMVESIRNARKGDLHEQPQK